MRTVLPASAVLVFATACAPQPAFKPVASVKQLMAATVVPSAEIIFDAVGSVVSERGVEDFAPKNDEEWTAVRNGALTLAESGNLLMIGARAKDQGEWIKLSQALVDVGMVAVKAAQAKNAEALFEAGGKVYEVCGQCHDKYWKEGSDPALR